METISRKDISHTSVNVLMINRDGVMVQVSGSDYFISYSRAPWFKEAKLIDIFNVQMEGHSAICWPTLDVDFEIDSLKHPERYPLVMKRFADETL